MKIIVKEPVFTTIANIDERLKQSKNKLVIRNPPIFVIRPKPLGVVITERKNNGVYKADAVVGAILKKSDQTVVYKQSP